MPTNKTATAFTVLALLIPALRAQDKTDNPCTDTAKAKVKRGLGNILKNTPLGQAVTGNSPTTPDCPDPKKPGGGGPVLPASPSLPKSSNAQTPTATTASADQPRMPVPAPNDQQPKIGTIRKVKYNGAEIAIATGREGNSDNPVTYVIVPGSVRPPVKVTADPDIYVSLNSPPSVYTVRNGELFIQDPKQEVPPPTSILSTADAFGGQSSGRATGEGITVTWDMEANRLLGGQKVLTVYIQRSGHDRGIAEALGQNTQGECVHVTGGDIQGYFMVRNGTVTRVAQKPSDLK